MILTIVLFCIEEYPFGFLQFNVMGLSLLLLGFFPFLQKNRRKNPILYDESNGYIQNKPNEFKGIYPLKKTTIY